MATSTKTASKQASKQAKTAAEKVCPCCGQKVRPPTLTDQQKRIVRMVALGMTSPQIAQELELSSRTIEFHRSLIMSKLRVTSVAGLTLYASKNGLV